MNRIAFVFILLVSLALSVFTSCKENRRLTANQAMLELDTVIYNQLFTLGVGTSEQKLEVIVKYIYPTNDTLISHGLAVNFFPEDLAHELYTQPDSLLELYSQRLYEDFQSDAVQEVSEPSASLGNNWIQEFSNEIVYQDRHIVSTQVRQYTFAGGAHGFEYLGHMSIDRYTGKIVHQADLFVDDYQDELAKIIIGRLMAQHNVSTAEELNEYGFFDVSEIVPNNNFYLTDTDMVYIFNTYEIAPYAVGSVVVKIPYDLLGSLIRTGSLLEHYV